MLQIHVAKGCKPTADILYGLLVQNGLAARTHYTLGDSTKPLAHLCWGFAPAGLRAPTLNLHVNRTKLSELVTLSEAKVLTVPWHLGNVMPTADWYPVLARNEQHHGGRDIRFCRTPEQLRRAFRRGRAFFTKFIPSHAEFRVWVYRRRHLGTYEKVLTYPKKQFNRRGHRKVGRNYHNGWTFQLVGAERIPREAVNLAQRAVDALSLDFGAVDILQGMDGRYYVLEVNAAPGVQGDARQVIQGLAEKVANWYKKGFPKRKGEKED